MNADTTIKRPALRYYGGKWNLAPWIISFFPPHKNYVEPCGGAASVLLQKPRSPLETYNDLDGNVVNFFRVLRDNPDELINKVKLTPFSREEFEMSWQLGPDPTENARRLFAHHWMSMVGMANLKQSKTWACEKDADAQYTMKVIQFENVKSELFKIAERLLAVQIENADAIETIKKFDNENALIYFDPPYLQEVRKEKNVYTKETDIEFHQKAACALYECKGFAIVSGYPSNLYSVLYEAKGWKRVDRMARGNSGSKRVESLWLNSRAWEAQSQKSLFTQEG